MTAPQWPPHSLLAILPDAARERLLSRGVLRRYQGPSRILIREHDESRSVIIILPGVSGTSLLAEPPSASTVPSAKMTAFISTRAADMSVEAAAPEKAKPPAAAPTTTWTPATAQLSAARTR